MIKLITRAYCEHCSEFEPYVKKYKNFESGTETIITCSNADKCAGIHDYIRKEISKNE